MICLQKMRSLMICIAALMTSTSLYALPFSITPTSGTTLPTEVIPGQTATALYTVINNTSTVRAGNYVKYLPPNVTQVTTDPTYPDLCGSTFTLNARGTGGSSCTLVLSVSGPVDATDPDPHHHLFVCFPGGITCAGTPNPLNVSAEEPVAFRRSYVANFGDNTVSLCSVDAITGELTLCADSGAGAVFSTPLGIRMNPAGSYFYATDFGGGGGTTVSVCPVNMATGTLSVCALTGAFFGGPSNVTFNASGTQAYVSSLGTSVVSLCSVNQSNGQLTGCADTGTGFTFPVGISLTAGGTRAYVSNAAAGTTVSLCAVNTTTGELTNCNNADGDTTAVFIGPAFTAFNSDTTRVYVSNNAGGGGATVSFCTVNVSTGTFNNCQDSGVGAIFVGPAAVNLNADNTLLYVTNQNSTTVSQCTVDLSTGLLTGCAISSSAFNGPSGMIFVY